MKGWPHVLALLCLLSAPLVAQDQGEEPGQDSAIEQMAAVQAAVAKITAGFATVDKLLNGTVEDLASAETEPDLAEGVGQKLGEATASARELVADMEHLLEILPQPPPPPPSPGSGKASPRQVPPQQEPSQDPTGNQPAADKENSGGQQPPPEAPLRSMLRDPRAGEWGQLPPRLQQAIDNANAEALPLRYRRWLLEYHRHSSEQD